MLKKSGLTLTAIVFLCACLFPVSCGKMENPSPTAVDEQTEQQTLLSKSATPDILACRPDILVTTTADVTDFGGAQQVGDLPGPDGKISLREAIIAANNSSGPNGIGFKIPKSDPGFDGAVFTIKPSEGLPELSGGETIINGATQAEFTGNTNPAGPEVVLDCSLLPDWTTGLLLTSAQNQIHGLVINRHFSRGGHLVIAGAEAMQNVVTGCFLGLAANGTAIFAPVDNSGVGISNGASRNLIGGTKPQERNVISGNMYGIKINTRNNEVIGNFIGTDFTGTVALGNIDGLLIQGSDNVIGAGNVISGNGNGIFIEGSGNIIEGNMIGTAATGRQPLGNQTTGIWVRPEAENTRISKNLISGNADAGLRFDGYNGSIDENLVGTDLAGNPVLGNAAAGIHVYKGAMADHGTLTIEKNRIAANGSFGVIMEGVGTIRKNVIFRNGAHGIGLEGILEGPSFTHARITQNSIFDNAGLGIDIDTAYGGVNPNDPGDADFGANNGMNYPVLKKAITTRWKLLVTGQIDTPNPEKVTIEFFANAVPYPGGDPSGHGEGAVFLGNDKPNKQGKFLAILPAVAPGMLISATATDAGGNTSEFSANIVAKQLGAGGCVEPPAGMIAWWPGDGNAEDVVGGHDGTLIGGATYTSGKVEQAFAFPNANIEPPDYEGSDWVSIADHNDWEFGGGNFTIDLWVYFYSVENIYQYKGGGLPLVGHTEGGGNINKWIVWYQNDGLKFHVNQIGTEGWDSIVCPWSPNAHRWYHVAVTRAGNIWNIFIDGSLKATTEDTRAIPDADADLTIGKAEETWLQGMIDEVEIFHRALSAAEIQEIYNAGSAGKCK